MAAGYWTPETYRLDEVTNKFSLPCVVCFSEGFMDATESESISKDDVIKIDKRLKLQKVAAEFVNYLDETIEIPDSADPYERLTEEILIPLNYAGTVKVLQKQTVCNGVGELQRASPRYAVTLSNMSVKGEDSQPITIQAGTRIQVDRTIPGNRGVPANLVISWNQNGSDVVVAVSVANKGQFKTMPDDNEYTLNEVIDRYGFPVVVTFVDDEIRRIYTMDLEEGIDNMKLISATLRLKRLESQDAIIGHYKPLENHPGQRVDSEYFARRSLVVLPLDNYDIRDIQCHVLQGTDEEVYESIFLVSNKSHELNDVLDGTLYVDFSRKAGPRRVQTKKKKEAVQSPPPRPPKPSAYKTGKELYSTQKQKDKGDLRHDYYFTEPPNMEKADGRQYPKPLANKRTSAAAVPKAKTKPPDIPDENDEEYYEEMNPPPLDQLSPVSLGSPLADLNFDKYVEMDLKGNKPKPLEDTWKKIKRKVASVTGVKDTKQEHKVKSPGDGAIKTPEATPPIVEEEEGVFYDYPDTEEMKDLRLQVKQMAVNRPVAHVSPQSASGSTGVKPFRSLTKSELVERLVRCGMTKFAAVCRDSDLDGKFFDNISNDVLEKKPFMLSAIDLIKLDRIKEDWIPS